MRLPLALLCTTALYAFQLSAETLTGVVTNQSLGTPQADCVVMLLQHGQNDAVSSSDTTDANGVFSFVEVSREGAAPLILSAFYKEVIYSEPVPADAGSASLSVYEITESDAAITVLSHHLVVDVTAGEMMQILVVRNNGDRTFRTGGGHRHGLEVQLPDGVSQIRRAPEGVHTHGSTLVDPTPVQPGGYQLVFTVPLPATGHLHQTVNYPTDSVDLLLTPAETAVQSEAMTDEGTVNFDGRSYRRFSASELGKGGRIDLRFSGLAAAPSSESLVDPDQLRWGIGLLALLFGILALFYRPKRSSESRGVAVESNLELRRQVLMQSVADLDDRLDEGRIEKEDYERRRTALKAEILELTQAIRGNEESS